jgi:hypothetical protein
MHCIVQKLIPQIDSEDVSWLPACFVWGVT